MSLYRLIGQFLRRHWTAYVLAGLMLLGIALLIVWIPRQVRRLVDGLVANRLAGADLLHELAWLAGAGVVVYFLRAGWRLKLFAAALSGAGDCGSTNPTAERRGRENSQRTQKKTSFCLDSSAASAYFCGFCVRLLGLVLTAPSTFLLRPTARVSDTGARRAAV